MRTFFEAPVPSHTDANLVTNNLHGRGAESIEFDAVSRCVSFTAEGPALIAVQQYMDRNQRFNVTGQYAIDSGPNRQTYTAQALLGQNAL